MTIINAFHPDYVKTYHPDLTKTIIKEQKAKENGQLYGSKAREREPSIDQPTSNTINQFPKATVIQAARSVGFNKQGDAYCALPVELEALYNLAYKAGEKAMQERAAKVAWNNEPDDNGLIEIAIRALKFTGETNE